MIIAISMFSYQIRKKRNVELEFTVVLDDSIFATPGKYFKFFCLMSPTHTQEAHDESKEKKRKSRFIALFIIRFSSLSTTINICVARQVMLSPNGTSKSQKCVTFHSAFAICYHPTVRCTFAYLHFLLPGWALCVPTSKIIFWKCRSFENSWTRAEKSDEVIQTLDLLGRERENERERKKLLSINWNFILQKLQKFQTGSRDCFKSISKIDSRLTCAHAMYEITNLFNHCKQRKKQHILEI